MRSNSEGGRGQSGHSAVEQNGRLRGTVDGENDRPRYRARAGRERTDGRAEYHRLAKDRRVDELLMTVEVSSGCTVRESGHLGPPRFALSPEQVALIWLPGARSLVMNVAAPPDRVNGPP